jgi:3-oxoacyl-ACP reductase-like protein
MNIFTAIMNKIFHHNTPAAAQPAPAPAAAPVAAAPAAAPTPPPAPVDVEAVLEQVAATKGGGGNWRTSIVDLLKMLDLDSSLTARKALGEELGVHAGADGSAEQNIALQKAVWAKLAENGGKVPASLRD